MIRTLLSTIWLPMAGRPPKPTAVKIAEGNRGKRPLNKQEPDPEYLDDLRPPEWLNTIARQIWAEIAPGLRKAKLLTVISAVPLAMGCSAWADYMEASRKVDQTGQVLISKKSSKNEEGTAYTYVNPWVHAKSMAFKQALAVFSRFGMTPVDLTRIAINPQTDIFDEVPESSPGKNYYN
jgi:P27 family predicted phage terminase small subunit